MLRREDKPKVVQELKSLIASNRTVGILDMSKMPARQFLKIKNNITKDGSVRIKMARKALLARALSESAKPDVAKLLEHAGGSPAMIFSSSDPFRLFAALKRNCATSAAKVGDVVAKDIVIPKGPTQIPPGPAISTFGKIGLKTRVEGGKIAIINEKIVLKSGQPVTEDLAAVFSLLKIEPIEVGIGLSAAWEDGMVYGRDVLDVDVETYLAEIERAVQAGVNLSLNAGYITKLTAPLAIQLAFWRAKSLCLAADILEKDVIGELLAKAVAEAKSLEEKVPAQAPAEQPPAES